MRTHTGVVVFGSLNRDYVCRVATIPAPGQTLLGGRLTIGCGGKGGNQAAAAALLGVPTAMIGCVGDDDDGRALLAGLSAAGTDVTGVATVEARSGTAFVMVADDGENAIVVAGGANDLLDSARAHALVTPRVAAGSVLVAQAETPSEGVAAAIRIADQAGARVVLNLAPSRPVDRDLLSLCDPLIVNEGEALDLLRADTGGGLDASEIARRLGRAVRSVIVTLGGNGAVVVTGDGPTHVPALVAEVVDTTGAGDAFTGAVAAALASGADLVGAARIGTAVAAMAVSRPGAQASYPTRAELVERFGDALDLSHLPPAL